MVHKGNCIGDCEAGWDPSILKKLNPLGGGFETKTKRFSIYTNKEVMIPFNTKQTRMTHNNHFFVRLTSQPKAQRGKEQFLISITTD